ncbi:MAG: pyruvate kinase alpha/beta domain-containing protein, partial [Lachnospiraceae bacterium]
AVKTMVKIATRTEQDINYRQRLKNRELETNPDITNAISHATVTTAADLNAAAIITVTKSGRTARNIEKFRPGRPIIGCSMDPKVVRQLNLSWGVTPLLVEKKDDADELFEHAVEVTEKAGLIEQGDVVVITAGVPLGVSGTTNLIKVHVAGHILTNGEGIGEQAASGNLCVAKNIADLEKNFQPGDIVVASKITSDMIKSIRKAAGIIVEAAEDANAIAVGESLNIPVLLNTKNATDVLTSGAYVTVDPKSGAVSCNEHEA